MKVIFRSSSFAIWLIKSSCTSRKVCASSSGSLRAHARAESSVVSSSGSRALFLRRMETTYGNALLTSTHPGDQTAEQFIRQLEAYYKNKLRTIESQESSDRLESDRWKPLVDTLTKIVEDMNNAELEQLFVYTPKTRDNI